MSFSKMAVENGELVTKESKVIDQKTLTSDCWMVQFEGLSACSRCKYKGKRSCGGGETLKRLQKTVK